MHIIELCHGYYSTILYYTLARRRNSFFMIGEAVMVYYCEIFNRRSNNIFKGERAAEGGKLIIAVDIEGDLKDVDVSGVDAIAGASIVVKDSEVMGNTEYMAMLVQETIGGGLFCMETVEDYPLDHNLLVEGV